jgi:hypothetical protein
VREREDRQCDEKVFNLLTGTLHTSVSAHALKLLHITLSLALSLDRLLAGLLTTSRALLMNWIEEERINE